MSDAPRRKIHLLRCSLLIALVLSVHLGTLGGGPIVDDHAIYSSHNTFYRSWSHLTWLFSRDFLVHSSGAGADPGAQTAFSGCVSYRPLTALTFFWDTIVGGSRPFFFRLTNLLLHLGVVLLVYVVAVLWGRGPSALWAALLFGLHPIHAEVVADAGYRSDLLCAFFFLLAWAGYLRFRSCARTGRGWLIVSQLSFFLALLAKEVAVALPFLVAMDVVLRRKRGEHASGKILWGYGAVLIVYLILYFGVFPDPDHRGFLAFLRPDGGRILLALRKLALYADGLLRPQTVKVLPPLYELRLLDTTPGHVAAGLTVGAIGLAALVRAFRRGRDEAVLLAWAVLTYLPVSGLLPLISPIGYRYVYLPSAALAVLAAGPLRGGVHRAAAFFRMPSLPRWVGAASTVFLGLLTVAALMLYKNENVNARAMLRAFPDASVPHLMLGHEAFRRGRYAVAAAAYQAYVDSSERDPHPSAAQDYLAVYRLGVSLYRTGMWARAGSAFERAGRLRPGTGRPFLYVALIAARRGDASGSIAPALQALKDPKTEPAACVLLADAYRQKGDAAKARSYLNRLRSVDPGNVNLPLLERRIRGAE